jgi:hypothetical protein
MDPTPRLLFTTPPNLADPRQAQAVIDLLGTQWRNVVLLLVYFAVLAGLAVLALGWVSRGYTQWKGITVVGWAVVGLPLLGALLAVWRLTAEEGPRWQYPRNAGEYAALRPVRGTVTGLGVPVALGAPLASRQVKWETANPVARGASPYLPMRLVQQAPVGSGVWVAVDPTGQRAPLFIGLAR